MPSPLLIAKNGSAGLHLLPARSQVARELIRGVLGSLLGSKRR